MIDNSFYTVEQISEMLNLHEKTVQRYIREGKLRASKIGKGWRVSGHDLSVFAEKSLNTEAEKPGGADSENAVKVSTVIDIEVRSKDDAMRIANTLTAALNVKPPEYGASSMATQFIENENKVRIMLWGGLSFTETILKSVEALTNREGIIL